jgi:putative ABC transport system ATP-binding protein
VIRINDAQVRSEELNDHPQSIEDIQW